MKYPLPEAVLRPLRDAAHGAPTASWEHLPPMRLALGLGAKPVSNDNNLARAERASEDAAARPASPNLFDRIRRYFRDQRDYAELLQMSDHMLRDIGLTRSEIEAARQSLRLF